MDGRPVDLTSSGGERGFLSPATDTNFVTNISETEHEIAGLPPQGSASGSYDACIKMLIPKGEPGSDHNVISGSSSVGQIGTYVASMDTGSVAQTPVVTEYLQQVSQNHPSEPGQPEGPTGAYRSEGSECSNVIAKDISQSQALEQHFHTPPTDSQTVVGSKDVCLFIASPIADSQTLRTSQPEVIDVNDDMSKRQTLSLPNIAELNTETPVIRLIDQEYKEIEKATTNPTDSPTPSDTTFIKAEHGQGQERNTTVPISLNDFSSVHCSKIMSDIVSQRQSGKFCDVLIETADHHQIWAHKCVLSANSPYLDSILLNSTDQPSKGKLPFEVSGVQELSFNEYSRDAIEAFISYMYSGRISLGIEQADQLLQLGDQFQMADLKEQCSEVISSLISPDNWRALYRIAEKFGLSNLFTAISKCVFRSADLILNDKEFFGLEQEQIINIVKRDLEDISEQSEQTVFKIICYWVSHDFTHRQNFLDQCLGMIREKELEKSRMYRYLETELSEIKNSRVLSHPTLVNWLLSLHEEKEQCDDDFDYENGTVSDETAVDSDDELFVPGKEITNVMPSRRTRGSTPKRKRKSSNPQRMGLEVSPAAVNPPVKRGRGRPRLTEQKKKPGPKPKAGSSRPKKVGRPRKNKCVEKDVATIDVVPGAEEEKIKTEPEEPTNRAPRVKTVSKCPECSDTFTSQNAFRQHMKVHGELKPFKCNLCSFQTIHYGIFTSHKRRQHRVDIRCPKCPREFPSQSALNHHMRGHGSDTPFLCDVCGFTTKHFASMNIHKRRHNGKMLKCTHEGCTYESTRHTRLRDHMNMHLGVKNYICPVCGKAFGARKHLSRHENIHKTAKALNCKKLKCPHEGCTYEAVRHTRLRDHMNMHLGLKNYICTVCGKAFGARKHLFRHENIHKTDKTLNCDQCAYTTSRRDKIRQHIKRHHPNTAVVLGYLTEHEAAVQIHKNLNNEQKTAAVKRSPKKKKKTKEEPDCTTEDVCRLEPVDAGGVGGEPKGVRAIVAAGGNREMSIAQLPPLVPHVINPIINAGEQQDAAGKSSLKETVTVPPSAASTIVDMIHYFMAPDGASSEQHHATWNYQSNPL